MSCKQAALNKLAFDIFSNVFIFIALPSKFYNGKIKQTAKNKYLCCFRWMVYSNIAFWLKSYERKMIRVRYSRIKVWYIITAATHQPIDITYLSLVHPSIYPSNFHYYFGEEILV